jgi:hypothetical protein
MGPLPGGRAVGPGPLLTPILVVSGPLLTPILVVSLVVSDSTMLPRKVAAAKVRLALVAKLM